MKISLMLSLSLVALGLATVATARSAHSATKQRAIDAPFSNKQPPKPPKNAGFKPGVIGREKRSLTCGTQPKVSAVQAKEAVYAHNLFRSKEAATNMLKMKWSDEMAAVAQAWADKCVWEHDMLYDCSGDRLGQNLFVEASSGGFPALNLTAVTEAWNDERNDWDFTTDQCNAGKVCGHWTQLAWARTTEVGCAYKECPTMDVGGSEWKNALYVVCDYTPPGNVYGQQAFEKGEHCTNCDSDKSGHGFKCSNNLCSQCEPGVDSTCKCGETLFCLNNGTWSDSTCSCQCTAKFYGNQCEHPCSCDDQDEGCPYWTQYCPLPEYSDFLYERCKKTCGFPCSLPASCPTQSAAR